MSSIELKVLSFLNELQMMADDKALKWNGYFFDEVSAVEVIVAVVADSTPTHISLLICNDYELMTHSTVGGVSGVGSQQEKQTNIPCKVSRS